MIEELIETTLQHLIPPSRSKLFEMAQYSLRGGKLLRPLLMLSVLEAYGIPLSQGLFPACALEMVHTYSLIHDDLPCMDDDDERRGKPSLHRAYPESHAVLTGDFLLTYAFEVLAKCPDLDAETRLELIITLAKRSGNSGMIGGQILDLEGADTPETIRVMHLKKTAAMITASLEFGAIVAQEDPLIFREIGNDLGLSFQIVDDLLDQDGMVLIFGEEKTREMAEEHFHQAFDKILSLQLPTRGLENLARKAIFREV
jgi:geranylgeranyl diphosphate synthase, type II